MSVEWMRRLVLNAVQRCSVVRGAMSERMPALVPVSVLTLLGLALRLHWLGSESLGLDEAATLAMASRPLPEMVRLLAAQGVHPPLYPAILHFWTAVAGSGEFAVRLPSALFGAGLIPLVYLVGRQLELLARPDERPTLSPVGSAGAILVTYSALYIADSRVVHSHSALTFMGLLSSLLLLRSLRSTGWVGWLVYGLVTLAALYTHYAALLLVAFHFLFVALVGGTHRGARVRWMLCVLALAVAYLPWLGHLAEQTPRIVDYWSAGAGPDDLSRAPLERLTVGDDGSRLLAAAVPVLLAVGLLSLGVLALLRGLGRRSARHALFLMLYLLVPAVPLCAPAYGRMELDPRLLLAASPAFYLIAAWGVGSLLWVGATEGRDPLLRAAAASLGAALLVATAMIWTEHGEPWMLRQGDPSLASQRPADYRALVAFVERNSKPGDAVVLMMDSGVLYDYYGKLPIPRVAAEPSEDFEAAILRLNRWAESYRRLWFVLWQKERVDPADHVMHAMEEQASETELNVDFGGLGLRLFELAPGSRFSYHPRIDHRAGVLFGDRLELAGWNVSNMEGRGGDEVRFDLHWRPLEAIRDNLRIDLSLVDGGGHVWARADEMMATPFYPSSRWKPRALIHDRHELRLPPGVPPGDYWVELRLYDPATRGELSVDGQEGVGGRTVLSLVRFAVRPTPAEAFQAAAGGLVEPPPLRPSLRSLSGVRETILWLARKATEPPAPVRQAAMARWELEGGRIELLGSRVFRHHAKPGEEVEVALLWRAPAALSADYSVWIALLDARGDPVAEHGFALVPGYPTSRWRAGEVVQARYWLALPAPLPFARYEVAVAVAGTHERKLPMSRYTHVSSLDVPLGPPLLALPPMQNRVGALLGGRVELAGFDLDSTRVHPGDSLHLTLYWRALDGFGRGYKVFNHVIDEGNVFGGQRDGIPVAATRPTTTWREREVVVDRHQIPIFVDARPGSYLLKTGMYAQEGGARMPIVDVGGRPAGDSVTLARIEVVP